MPATVTLQANGTLVIRGDQDFRNIGGVSSTPAGGGLVIGRVSVMDAGNKLVSNVTKMYPASGVTGVVMYGGGKNDNLSNTTALPCTMYGGAGNDLLTGGSGSDCLVGGDGQDYLDGRAGNDTLLGGAARDYLAGGPGDDLLDGGPGDDWQYGGGGNDTLIGGPGTNSPAK